MTHDMFVAAAEGPSVGGPLAAVLAITLALITAASGIIVARITKGKPEKVAQGNITVTAEYIAELKQNTVDEETQRVASEYRVEVLRRGVRMLREWIIRNTSANPDHIVDDEVNRLS